MIPVAKILVWILILVLKSSIKPELALNNVCLNNISTFFQPVNKSFYVTSQGALHNKISSIKI
jgi:hypothetical protein